MKRVRYVPPEPERMLTASEAAEVLGLTRSTILRIAARGDLASYRPAGVDRVSFRLGDIYEYRDAARRESEPREGDVVTMRRRRRRAAA